VKPRSAAAESRARTASMARLYSSQRARHCTATALTPTPVQIHDEINIYYTVTTRPANRFPERFCTRLSTNHCLHAWKQALCLLKTR